MLGPFLECSAVLHLRLLRSNQTPFQSTTQRHDVPACVGTQLVVSEERLSCGQSDSRVGCRR